MPPALPGLEAPEPGYPRGSEGVSALGWDVVLRSSLLEGLVTPGAALGPQVSWHRRPCFLSGWRQALGLWRGRCQGSVRRGLWPRLLLGPGRTPGAL